MARCELDASLHDCQYLDRDTLECRNPGTCTFQEQPPKEPVPEQRKPRWYDQYYEARGKKKTKENITELRW